MCILSSYYYSYMACFDFTNSETSYFYTMLGLEIYFLIVIILRFITDFKKEGELVATRDFVSGAKHYLKNGFIMDLIPTLPF